MDITKLVFNTIDVAFDRRQNRSVKIEGSQDVVITKDILYNPESPKTCLLDCYYVPKKEGLYPVLFNIHGGGFVAGGKEHRRTLCTWLATFGFFVININYGLSPECSFPLPLKHMSAALEWLREYAPVLRLDLSRVAVYGDSSGAYYASMLAAAANRPELCEMLQITSPVKFAAAVLNCGLYDIKYSLSRRMVLHLNKRIFTAYTGIKESEFEHYKYKDFCSPLPYIDESYPPTFLVSADKDIFCGGQAEFIAKAFDENDVYYESYHSVSQIRNHCFSLEWTSKEAKEANALIKNFLMKMISGDMPRRMSDCDAPIRESERKQPPKSKPTKTEEAKTENTETEKNKAEET